MYFIELKYAGFLGAFSFLEQNCGIRNRFITQMF